MNRIVKLTVIMSVAFLTLMFLSGTAFRSVAYEAPQDIHMFIETKEVNIKDIPENRTVSLDIYTENCPPYLMLSFLLEKDKRLEYTPYKYLTDAEQVSNMGGMSFELGSSEKNDVVLCNISAVAGEKINYNGLLARAEVILPEDVKEGDFYSLNFRETFSDNYDMETSIILENDFDAVFGSESFSQLKGGGILIVGDKQKTTVTTSTETVTETVTEENLFSETETEISDTFQEVENISSETFVQTITSETVSDVVLSSSNNVYSSADSVSHSESSEMNTVSDTETAVTVADYGNPTENSKKSTDRIFIIAISAVCLTAGIVIFMKKENKKMR